MEPILPEQIIDEKLKQRYPELNRDAIDFIREQHGVKIVGNGPHNPISELYNAASTLADDPDGNKRRALLGAAGATAGLGLAVAGYRNKELRNVLAKRTPTSIIGTLLAAATPLAAYYALQNRDKPDKSLVGKAATGVAFGGRLVEAGRLAATMPKLSPAAAATLTAANIGMAGAVGGTIYAAHNLQAEADRERLNAIAADPKLTPEQREFERSMIVDRKDFLTRYPAFRLAPYSERLREEYNRYHGYVPPTGSTGASDYIRTQIRE